jgi:hypothetical protein
MRTWRDPIKTRIRLDAMQSGRHCHLATAQVTLAYCIS